MIDPIEVAAHQGALLAARRIDADDPLDGDFLPREQPKGALAAVPVAGEHHLLQLRDGQRAVVRLGRHAERAPDE